MKYLSVPTIYKALHRIYEGNTNEHRTSTATSGLLQHYFPVRDGFITTPEQIQVISNKKPDFTVERLVDKNEFVPHLFVEIKSLINSNFNDILDQLHDAVLSTVDLTAGNFSVYVIAMKGAKIAFFELHSYACLLDEYGITNYKGFIPLGYCMAQSEYMSINEGATIIDYLNYIKKIDVPHKIEILRELGVESTNKIQYPHIWDALNKDHADHVHNLFKTMAENKAGADIVD